MSRLNPGHFSGELSQSRVEGGAGEYYWQAAVKEKISRKKINMRSMRHTKHDAKGTHT